MNIQSIGRTIKGAINKPIDALERKFKKMDEARRVRDTRMIEQNWGSVEEYHKRRGN